MKIIMPYVDVRSFSDNPLMKIEQIGRTCYKSENNITEDSCHKFVANLFKNRHWAMLEHYRFIYTLKNETSIPQALMTRLANLPGFKITKESSNYNNIRTVISFNATCLNNIKYNSLVTPKDDLYWIVNALMQCVMQDTKCYELFGYTKESFDEDNDMNNDDYELFQIPDKLNDNERLAHEAFTAKFICDRGVTHEIVRHRVASFAQESTRYCNYTKDKFGAEITVIKPVFFNDDEINQLHKVIISKSPKVECTGYNLWYASLLVAEKAYMAMLAARHTPQEARSVLPNSLKTELIMTATLDEWKHFFKLRCDTPAHPQMRQLAIPLYQYMVNTYGDIMRIPEIEYVLSNEDTSIYDKNIVYDDKSMREYEKQNDYNLIYKGLKDLDLLTTKAVHFTIN